MAGRSPGLGTAFLIPWLLKYVIWAAIIGLLVEFSQGVARASAVILVAGTLQWPALRRSVRVWMWWIPATVVAVLGFTQWLVPRSRTDNRAGPWRLACVVGFIVGGLATYAAYFALWYPRYLAIVPLGVIYAAATGVVLTRMVFHAESRTLVGSSPMGVGQPSFWRMP